MAMRAIIMDTSYQRIGEVDDYISFIWTERYYTTGDFELIVPLTQRNAQICVMGNYVIRADIPDTTERAYDLIQNMGVIEQVEFDESITGVARMIVSGRFLLGVLSRRVCEEYHFNSSTPPNIAGILISWNMGISASASRVVDELKQPWYYKDDTGISSTIEAVFNGENLLDACVSLAENYGYGMRIGCWPALGWWRIQFYKGTDRSYGQNVNPYVVFADIYDNLVSSYYSEDKKDLVTDVLVNGETTDMGVRYVVWATNGSTNTGLNRYESFVESTQVRTLDDGTVLTDAQYKANLRQEGRLSIRNLEQAFSGEVLFNQYQYRTDVNVGDIVTIRNDRWGIYVNARILEMIESTSESGEYTCAPTFGI